MTRFDPTKATDTDLLSRFNEIRDQDAFAELVRRHGPMIFGTAHRVLKCHADAEEATQATLFALAKAAGKLRRKAAVSAWLHKIAHRCAVEIQRSNIRWRQKSERMSARLKSSMDKCDAQRCDPLTGVADEEIERILDEELAKMSEELRCVIVLCDLEGVPQEQAARQLGIPTATVNYRIGKGRKLLRNRMVRRGVTLTAAVITSAAAPSSSASAMSEGFIADVTSKATLYASGESIAGIGVSSTVIQTANKVISTMTKAKLITALTVAVAIIPFISPLSAIVGGQGNLAVGAELFNDSFDDGDVSDGQPVAWIAGLDFGEGTSISVADMSLVIENAGFGASARPDGIAPQGDTSIRSQVRLTSGVAIGISVRQNIGEEFDNYFFGLGADGFSVLGIGTPSGDEITLDSAPTDLTVANEDVLLQLDVIGDALQAWAWRPGSIRPTEPLLSATDDKISSGVFDVWAAGSPTSSSGAFRFVRVATTSIPIPEPTTAVPWCIGVVGLLAWRRKELARV